MCCNGDMGKTMQADDAVFSGVYRMHTVAFNFVTDDAVDSYVYRMRAAEMT